MSGAKKIEPVFEDPINAKIQRKFDLVFNESTSIKKESSDLFDEGGLDFNFDEMSMENNGKKPAAIADEAKIDLDFSLDDDETPEPPKAAAPVAKTAAIASDDGLDFSLDFDTESEFESTPVASAQEVEDNLSSDEGFSLDGIEAPDLNIGETTQKTIVISSANLTKSDIVDLPKESSLNSSADLMSTEEARANIETTIKDILRPKLDGGDDSSESAGGISDIDDSVLDFGGNTPSGGFVLSDVVDDDTFSAKAPVSTPAASNSESTGEFSIDTGDFDIADDMNFDADEEVPRQEPVSVAPIKSAPEVPRPAQVHHEAPAAAVAGATALNTEDSMRFQATIRALREEREDFIAQIKELKSETKELEQDNLTLKANLDEAKIEITILRKRHMVELEDVKYRLSMSEEKKAMADEKARQADMRREKLEQKVRIDFNQVKQREKELESKLELLSMDIDSQVQSRDQKILELRRKIDALEFNMENASIKEQKSLDDKRKLEDRLNKIMKTLRHSIKNLEDDIDHAQEDDDHQKEKN